MLNLAPVGDITLDWTLREVTEQVDRWREAIEKVAPGRNPHAPAWSDDAVELWVEGRHFKVFRKDAR